VVPIGTILRGRMLSEKVSFHLEMSFYWVRCLLSSSLTFGSIQTLNVWIHPIIRLWITFPIGLSKWNDLFFLFFFFFFQWVRRTQHFGDGKHNGSLNQYRTLFQILFTIVLTNCVPLPLQISGIPYLGIMSPHSAFATINASGFLVGNSLLQVETHLFSLNSISFLHFNLILWSPMYFLEWILRRGNFPSLGPYVTLWVMLCTYQTGTKKKFNKS